MATQENAQPVFTVGTRDASSRARAGVGQWLWRVVDRVSGLAMLQRLYVDSTRQPEAQFVDRALATLAVRYAIQGELERIPSSGPVVIVANHPHGALDGLIIASLALRLRADVRIVGNRLLERIPEIARMLVPVDVFGGRDASPANARALRDALRWLQQGGCLCAFPSGEVAHGGWGPQAEESAWHDSMARLAERAGAVVVRCEIDGSAGRLFRLAGRLSPRLRTALLPRLLLRQRSRTVGVHVGVPHHSVGVLAAPSAPAVVTTDAVRREVAPLLEAQVLVRQGGLAVCWTAGDQAPALLERIGRERETAFRAVGEGTGREIDLDAFDASYLHLCLWDEPRGCLAGAYRLGLADELSRARLPLYTQTLFEHDERWLAALGPAIELGRAFLAAPYQRQFAPLALLWSGIGRFVAARPQYRTLFGAVSIDTAYGPAARHAMVTYLQQHAMALHLASLVTPRHPLTGATLADGRLAWAGTFPTPDVSLLDDVVSRLDPRGRGVPVLLRQYLKLDARAVAFSIDPAFSHVLDALTVVDLPSVPLPMLRRFMGRAGADSYLAHHDLDIAAGAGQTPRRRA